jgi:hypothetical protein
MHQLTSLLILTLLLPGAASTSPRLLAHGEQSGISKPEKLVVKSQPELDRLWKRARAAGAPDGRKAAPKVDWSREMVIAVFLGERPSAGYRVEIPEVKESGGKLQVRVTEVKPPADAITASVITTPYRVVAVRRNQRPVQWVLGAGS